MITAVLKLNFHCQGCIANIQKTVTKTKGLRHKTFFCSKRYFCKTLTFVCLFFFLKKGFLFKLFVFVCLLESFRCEWDDNGQREAVGDG